MTQCRPNLGLQAAAGLRRRDAVDCGRWSRGPRWAHRRKMWPSRTATRAHTSRR